MLEKTNMKIRFIREKGRREQKVRAYQLSRQYFRHAKSIKTPPLETV